MSDPSRCIVPGCGNRPMACRRVCRDHNPRPWADDDCEWRKPAVDDDQDDDEVWVDPALWDAAGLTQHWDQTDLAPHIEALDVAARELAAGVDPLRTRVLRVRTEIVALDVDLGCMVACYNADTGELLGISVDPPRGDRSW